MAWQDISVQIIRNIINDIGETPIYSDFELFQMLAISAKYVSQELTFDNIYKSNIKVGTITPDPVTKKEDAFVNFVILKAACIADANMIRKKAGVHGLKAKVGRQVLEATSYINGFTHILGYGPNEMYLAAKKDWTFGTGQLISAILGPFVSNEFDPRSLGWRFRSYIIEEEEEMQTITLSDGLNGPYIVYEPTRFIAENAWKAVIGGDWNHMAIDARANVEVINCRIFGSRRAVWGHVDCETFLLQNCWVYGNYKGIATQEDVHLTIDHSLIEYNGCHPSYSHGVYWHGNATIQDSIIRMNAAYQLHGYDESDPTQVEGTITNCLIHGGRNAVVARGSDGSITFNGCTVAGLLDMTYSEYLTEQGNNLYKEDVYDDIFVSGYRGLYWPSENVGSSGCYTYDENATVDYAKSLATDYLWTNGFMYYWGYGEPSDFTPQWPGDPLLEV